jgi:hypothetical protein
MEEEDDTKADAVEEHVAAVEDQHRAEIGSKDVALKAAEREILVMREAMSAKDAECANLQLALECFNNEVDASERRVAEAAALREKNRALAAELAAANRAAVTAEEKAAAAAAALGVSERREADAKLAAQRAIGDASKARQALAASLENARHLMSETKDELIDKRIVSKLLATYFERDQSPEVLLLMASMLSLTPEQKTVLGPALRRRRGGGLVGGIARAPGRLLGGALGVAAAVASMPVRAADALTPEDVKRQTPGGKIITDQWVDFLLSQMDEEEDEGETSGEARAGAAGASA